MQRHQEIRRGTHTARKAVGNIQHCGFARTHRQRDVIEAHRKRILGRERATKAHATIQRELIAPFEQHANHFEEILVPTHGDAVFRHAAEAGHDAIAQ